MYDKYCSVSEVLCYATIFGEFILGGECMISTAVSVKYCVMLPSLGSLYWMVSI